RKGLVTRADLTGAVRHQNREQLVDRQVVEPLRRGEERLDALALTCREVPLDGRLEPFRELCDLQRPAGGGNVIDDRRTEGLLGAPGSGAEALAGEIHGGGVCQVA